MKQPKDFLRIYTVLAMTACTGIAGCMLEESSSVDICDNVSCGTDEICLNGTCWKHVFEEEECSHECKDGEICEDGHCKVIACTPTCSKDMLCIDGQCEPQEPEPQDTTVSIPIPEDDDPEDQPVPDIITPGEIFADPSEGLVTSEEGTTSEIHIKINQKPENDVTIPIVSNKPEIGVPDHSNIVFTPANWNESQKIVITGTTSHLEKDSSYIITIGPSKSDDKAFNDIKPINLSVIHYTTPPKPQEEIIEATELKLNTTEISLTYRQTAEITSQLLPENTTNKQIQWIVEKVPEDDQKEVDKDAVAISYHGSNSESIQLTGISEFARILKVTAKHGDLSASAIVHVKPYFSLSMKLDELYTFKNFLTPGMSKKSKDTIGNLSCNHLDEYTNHTLYSDLYYKFVKPRLFSIKKSDGSNAYYGTRASVVAAARFLVLQFPYDIPYAKKDMTTWDNGMPISGHYSWSTLEKQNDASKARVFGLHLTPKVHGNKYANILIEKTVPWGCLRDETQASSSRPPYNGLECTGFVSWVFRNGRFPLGDWYSKVFAETGECLNEHNQVQRNYLCIKRVDMDVYKSVGNPNDVYDYAYKKLQKLTEKDFIPVQDLKEDQIKAGDILWLGQYKRKNCNDTKVKSFTGHVAIVLGLERYSNGKIKNVHIGEAIPSAANALTTMTWEEFTGKDKYITRSGEEANNRWHAYYGKDPEIIDGLCVTRDARLIKMDNVYNFNYSKIEKLDSSLDKNILNTWKYTDFWQ